jgi:uncharacterized protein YcaQ
VAERFPVQEARRIALAAQGFADPRPSGQVDAGHAQRVIERVGLLQLDSVNVLCHSHYLPVFARLGPYPRELLDRMAWGEHRHEMFEFWAHNASMLPMATFPFLRWRMRAAADWVWDGWLASADPARPFADWRSSWDRAIQAPWAVISGMTRIAQERPGLVNDVLAVVAEHGPVAARDASPDGQRHGDGQDVGTGEMWNWLDAKIALEWLFCMGRVTTAGRRNFERFYDLTERVIPADVLGAPAPDQVDAQRELIRIAARALGIATEKQLRDYFRLPAEHSKARVAELVEADELMPARIDGVPQQVYLWAEARIPHQVRARALLSPFDSLIWDRDRTLRLFDFHYRISIYTPAAKRIHGYYVLPFLLGDRLVARVDVKADRKESALLVPTVHIEPGVPEREVADELADELHLMASWLELDRVVVGGQGDLGPALARTIRMS